MIALPLLFAYFSLSGGLVFPGAGLSKRFNIGKSVQIEYSFADFGGFKLTHDTYMCRLPSITGSIPTYTIYSGIGVKRFFRFIRSYLGFSAGIAVLNAGNNSLFFGISPSLSKQVSQSVPIFFNVGVPFWLSPENSYMQTINVGLSVSP